ncbi:hypothetical protein ACJMK2_003179 [Sinanodonta woodiana]|uniref:Uncharacterized protein n=1 Tax=Sinanodonta woodiana TaxID=1069815 RepID=A0ABD3Y0U4_SINWO
MWLFEMKIQMIESDIKQKQAISYQDMPVDLSIVADTLTSASKGKLRNIRQLDEGSKFQQRVGYLKKQLLLKLHRKLRGLSHVRDDVFLFFVKLKLHSIEVSRRKLSSPWIKDPYIR